MSNLEPSGIVEHLTFFLRMKKIGLPLIAAVVLICSLASGDEVTKILAATSDSNATVVSNSTNSTITGKSAASSSYFACVCAMLLAVAFLLETRA
ncbi:hypothetical protein V3C99_008879 [Haemonchus contortus]